MEAQRVQAMVDRLASMLRWQHALRLGCRIYSEDTVIQLAAVFANQRTTLYIEQLTGEIPPFIIFEWNHVYVPSLDIQSATMLEGCF